MEQSSVLMHLKYFNVSEDGLLIGKMVKTTNSMHKRANGIYRSGRAVGGSQR